MTLETEEAKAINTMSFERRHSLPTTTRNRLGSFASSYTRAQSYVGERLLEENAVSPNTSPTLPISFPATFIQEQHHRSGEIIPNDVNSYTSSQGEEMPLVVTDDPLDPISNKSTVPQTIFNSINTLMGVGMLSLPYGFKLTGWILGTLILITIAIVTSVTAAMLGRILEKHSSLKSYGEIANLYGGKSFQAIITFMFSLDLIGAMTSMILLFSGSFNTLFPQYSVMSFKISIMIVTFFLSYLPFSLLSNFSIVGVVCTSSLMILLLVCGLVVDTTPGSLIKPSPTSLWPQDLEKLLVALGIFSSPWGGHPVFPELYRDMRSPSQYGNAVKVAFFVTFKLDYFVAAMGYLMFGIECRDSIIENIITNDQYPDYVNKFVLLFMGLIPISKLPLISKPLITVYEVGLGLRRESGSDKENIVNFTKIVFTRLLFCTLICFIAILFSSFGQVVALLGSAICFTICLTMPLLFYLHVFANELSRYQKLFIYTGIIVSLLCAIGGTYGSIFIDL